MDKIPLAVSQIGGVELVVHTQSLPDPLSWQSTLFRQPLTDDEQRTIERASNRFERIALLLQEEVLSRELVLEMFAEPIVITWRKIGPHISYERARRYSRFQFRFQKLAEDAEQYLRERYPNHSIQGDADPS